MKARFPIGAKLLLAGSLVISGCVGVSVREPAGEGGAGGAAGDEEEDEPPPVGSGGYAGAGAVGGRSSGAGGSVRGGSGGATASAGEPSTGGEGAIGGMRHASCSQDLPATLPELPGVRQDPTGRPLFDLWRDVSCADAAAEAMLCSEASGAGGADGGGCLGLCFRGTASASDGVCSYGDIDVSCDGEGEAIGYDGGRCWMCSPAEVHARACCEGFAGFDCRAWPFPADGAPGMVCARHEDCEPGLVCGDAGRYAQGYGVCQCPGASVELPASCDFLWDAP